ncbi:MAG: VCBS repeat-containing protein [Phycisphaerales bacterium]|nr:VCBS repeat-containing protein [Phycisphaerales bacterium]
MHNRTAKRSYLLRTRFQLISATLPVMITGVAHGQDSCLPFGQVGFGPDTNCAGIASGDLNGDGYPDLVTVHGSSMALEKINVHIADGAGGYLPRAEYFSERTPVAVALGDMDLDGDLDIVTVVSSASDSITIYLNSGTGDFSAPVINVPLLPSTTPVGLLLSDLDLDNDLDVIFGHSQSTRIYVMLNTGGPQLLAAPIQYSTPVEVRNIDKADFDRDGDDDIVVSGNSGVAVMRNNDAGGFPTFMANLPLVRGGEAVAAGDIDNDGDDDIVFAQSSGGPQVGIHFWLNAGPGNAYTQGGFIPTTGEPKSIKLFRDQPPLREESRLIDPPLHMAVTVGSLGNTIGVYQNDGTGNYGPMDRYSTGEASSSGSVHVQLDMVDVNLDGYNDLLYAKRDIGGVLHGSFTGRFGFSDRHPTGITPTADLALLTGFDQDLDLIIANRLDNSFSIYKGINGVFASAVTMLIDGKPVFLRALDLSQDGDELDLVFAMQGDTQIASYKNLGAGNFDGPVFSDTGLTPHRFVPFTRFIGDTPSLAVIGEPGNQISIMNGSGTQFTVIQTLFANAPFGTVRQIAAGDMDNDGDDDLVVIESEAVKLYRNQAGTLIPEQLFVNFGIGGDAIHLADYDHDGDLDVLCSGGVPFINVLTNLGGGTFDPFFLSFPGNYAARTIAFADVSGDGLGDIITSNDQQLSQFAVNLSRNQPTLRSGVLQYAVADPPSDLLTGDLNHDGIADIITISAASETYTVIISEGGCSIPCPADLNGDGVLNFFDISAFLNAFNAMNPIADFTNDGVFNFFDVSAFLNAFNAGCP